MVLLPETAEHLDEKAAAATGSVGDADFSELGHEQVGFFEIACLAAGGGADFVHDFSGERVDQRIGHWRGDAGRGVIDAFVLAVGGKEHFVALAEDVLVYAAVVVVDNAAAQRLVPSTDAKYEIEFFAEFLEVGGVLIQPVPDALGKNLGVVILIEKLLKEGEEFGNDAVSTLGFPEPGKPRILVLGETVLHQAKVLNRAGNDEFVEEEDDGLGGLFGRRPFNLVELVVPDFEIFKELLLEFGFFGRVLEAAQGVEFFASFTATTEKIREGH